MPSSISCGIDDLIKVELSENAIKIGDEALEKAHKNQYLGIEFFGTIFNRQKKEISKFHELYNVDKNVTLSDFPLFWYLNQYLLRLKNLTLTDELTIILPGYTTESTFVNISLANERNNTFQKLEILKDYEILFNQYKRSQMKSGNQKKKVLFIDFGAFSAKATLISDNKILGYNFCEKCGMEELAFELSKKENITRKDAYEKMNNIDFTKLSIFEEFKLNVQNEIFEKINIDEVDEIQLVGGGCDYPFIRTAIGLITTKPFLRSFSSFSFLIDGYIENIQNYQKIEYRPFNLLVEYNGARHKPEVGENLGHFVTNATIAIIADEERFQLPRGISNIVDIYDIEGEIIGENQDVSIIESKNEFLFGLRVGNKEVHLKRSLVFAKDAEDAIDNTIKTDAAMMMIRLLMATAPKKKNRDEL
ncbi:hypothetical protein TRFO_36766 [Tritrichomonas foetus]|uniref:Uncharacterized protein n=1 Tax=Tritrichomonas foetus TaxID=1144522 RepID=A0A1J4JD06_9EUKA|nr:hypothetical protein TRFO_36766 [Tritrichomonas foetus]|eukprot:OHS97050.1 hypothetical protein TRFO_36766 [Tritrichomonas foetus]